MGVKDLMNLLKSKCPATLHSSPTKPVDGNFWIDTPLIVMAAIKKAEVQRENPIQVSKSSILRVFKQLKGIRKEAKLYWIFDGKHREEKKETCIQRSKNAEIYHKKCFENRMNTIDSGFEMDAGIEADLEVASVIVEEAEPHISTRQVYEEIKQYALSFGEVHLAEHDSEEYIARNMEENDVAISSDSDALPFGCYTVVQHFGSDKETWIYLQDVLDALEMDLQTFQELCVLLGTDFNPRLKGCGPVKCYSYMKEASSTLQEGPNDTLIEFAKANGGNEEWIQQALHALLIFRGF